MTVGADVAHQRRICCRRGFLDEHMAWMSAPSSARSLKEVEQEPAYQGCFPPPAPGGVAILLRPYVFCWRSLPFWRGGVGALCMQRNPHGVTFRQKRLIRGVYFRSACCRETINFGFRRMFVRLVIDEAAQRSFVGSVIVLASDLLRAAALISELSALAPGRLISSARRGFGCASDLDETLSQVRP